MNQDPATSGRITMTRVGVLVRAVYLAVWLVGLTVLIFVARGSASGGPVADRIAYAFAAALIPSALGAVTLISLSRGKLLTGQHLAISAFVMTVVGMWAAGQGLISREARFAHPGGGAAVEGFIAELRRDYPQVYAERKAVIDRRGDASQGEVRRRLAVTTAPALAAARAKVSDDLAVMGVKLQLDEYREALVRSPRICWDLATDTAPPDQFSAETGDREFRFLTEMLRNAATAPSSAGPAMNADDINALQQKVAADNLQDAAAVSSIFEEGRAPVSDFEGQAFCRYQIALLGSVLQSGPKLAGKYVRGS